MLLTAGMTRQIHRRRDIEPGEGIEKYGHTAFADPVHPKYPIDTPGRIKAPWVWAQVRKARDRKLTLPDPDEFVELFDRVWKKKPG